VGSNLHGFPNGQNFRFCVKYILYVPYCIAVIFIVILGPHVNRMHIFNVIEVQKHLMPSLSIILNRHRVLELFF